jgi:hypothetical protein
MPGSPVNLTELLKQVAVAFDIMPPELIIAPPQPQLPAAPVAPNGGQQQPEGVSLGQPPMMNGQLLPAQVQQAITGR